MIIRAPTWYRVSVRQQITTAVRAQKKRRNNDTTRYQAEFGRYHQAGPELRKASRPTGSSPVTPEEADGNGQP